MSSLRLAPLAALLCFVLPAAAQAPIGERETLVIETQNGPQSFDVEIADEPRERSVGLMYRREMAKEAGMLFDFGGEEPVSMWMANTYIPLDMLFIRADGTVSSIAERTTPLSERSISSKERVRYVLEVNGGVSDALGIEQGDKVSGPAMEALQ
jgi:uncharacterized membrane protein (UPF0127 family)